MSFKENSYQQMFLTDIFSALTSREQKVLEKSWAKVLPMKYFPPLMETGSLYCTAIKHQDQIEDVSCYYWLLCLLKLVVPASLNRCFTAWTSSVMPESMEGLIISRDEKNICSTKNCNRYIFYEHI